MGPLSASALFTNLNLSAGDQVVLTSLHGEVILDNPKLLSTAIA